MINCICAYASQIGRIEDKKNDFCDLLFSVGYSKDKVAECGRKSGMLLKRFG